MPCVTLASTAKTSARLALDRSPLSFGRLRRAVIARRSTCNFKGPRRFPRSLGSRHIRKKGFLTKTAAQRYESDFFATLNQTGRSFDDRLADLVALWHFLHGCSKEEKHHLSCTLAVVEMLGNPRASEFDALAWARYRQWRLKAAAPQTVNHEQRYLSAVFSELIRLGAWSGSTR